MIALLPIPYPEDVIDYPGEACLRQFMEIRLLYQKIQAAIIARATTVSRRKSYSPSDTGKKS
jgi:hypothetical protein